MNSTWPPPLPRRSTRRSLRSPAFLPPASHLPGRSSAPPSFAGRSASTHYARRASPFVRLETAVLGRLSTSRKEPQLRQEDVDLTLPPALELTDVGSEADTTASGPSSRGRGGGRTRARRGGAAARCRWRSSTPSTEARRSSVGKSWYPPPSQHPRAPAVKQKGRCPPALVEAQLPARVPLARAGRRETPIAARMGPTRTARRRGRPRAAGRRATASCVALSSWKSVRAVVTLAASDCFSKLLQRVLQAGAVKSNCVR